jgi:hypothetical protein
MKEGDNVGWHRTCRPDADWDWESDAADASPAFRIRVQDERGRFVERQGDGAGWEDTQFAEPPPEVLSGFGGEAAASSADEVIEAAEAGAGCRSPHRITGELQAARELLNIVSGDGVGDEGVRNLLTPNRDFERLGQQLSLVVVYGMALQRDGYAEHVQAGGRWGRLAWLQREAQ